MSITASTKVYGVIGDPVSHSLSPVMHNGWIADHGLDAVYVALPLKSDDPVAAIRALNGFAGLNVTVPYKEAAAKAAARSEGLAANVLRREEDGEFSAFNTDGLGFINSLSEGAPDWRARVRRVLILGAGGGALASARRFRLMWTPSTLPTAPRRGASRQRLPFPMAELHAGTILSARSATRTSLCRRPLSAWRISRKWTGRLRFAARTRSSPISCIARSTRHCCRPHAHATLSPSTASACSIHQGARAFELWFGIEPDVAKARQRLLAALA